jgi:hypothetical protein
MFVTETYKWQATGKNIKIKTPRHQVLKLLLLLKLSLSNPFWHPAHLSFYWTHEFNAVVHSFVSNE